MPIPQQLKRLALRLAKLQNRRMEMGVAPEELREFERTSGMRVPQVLADWLLFANGGLMGLGMVGIGRRKKEIYDVESLYILHPSWRDKGWIPVADDRCGSFHVLLTQSPSGPTNPIVFIDHAEDMTKPTYAEASDLWHFLEAIFTEETAYLEGTSKWSKRDFYARAWPEYWWPFDREKTLAFDPELAKVPFVLPWDVHKADDDPS